jgi:hypothetical protein
MVSSFRWRLAWSLAVIAPFLLAQHRLAAQQGAVELGIDSEMAYHIIKGDGNDVFEMSLPFATSELPRAHNGFRVGYFASDRVSIEPSLGFSYVNPQRTGYSWNLGLATAIHYHLVADPRRVRPYLGAGVNMTVFHDYPGAGTGVTTSQFGVSAEFGFKIPIQDRLGIRLAGGVGQFFRSADYESRTSIIGILGFSYFTK